MPSSDPSDDLRDISTRWSEVKDIDRFVLRYTDAMMRFLSLVIGDDDVARDVLQSFLLKIIQRGFRDDLPGGGKFRDYLAKSLRNAAIDHFRSRKMVSLEPSHWQNLQSRWDDCEDLWRRQWTECLLDRAWEHLDRFQYSRADSIAHDVLRYATENPDQSVAQAARTLGDTLRRDITPDAYRQQLSRARKRFAEYLIAEIRQTLSSPDEANVRDEAAALGLSRYVT